MTDSQTVRLTVADPATRKVEFELAVTPAG